MTSDEALAQMLQDWEDTTMWLTDEEVEVGYPIVGDHIFIEGPCEDESWGASATDIDGAEYKDTCSKGSSPAEVLTNLATRVQRHNADLRARLEAAR